MNLLNTIEHKKTQMSNAELKVCDFVLKHPEQVEYYTITKLATQADTSTSAVLRFCQTLGFRGYKDFRFVLMNDLKTMHQEDNGSKFDSLVNNYIKTLNSFKMMDQSVIENLIEEIKYTKNISICGMHYSSLPAKQLSYGLTDLGYMNYLVQDYLEFTHLLNAVSNQSLFIYFSINGSKNGVLHYLVPNLEDSLPESSYLITLNDKAPLSDYFKHTITLPGSYLSHNSIIDNESIFSMFVEIILNMLSL